MKCKFKLYNLCIGQAKSSCKCKRVLMILFKSLAFPSCVNSNRTRETHGMHIYIYIYICICIHTHFIALCDNIQHSLS